MGKGITKFQIIFIEKAITRFGGLFLIHQFCQKLKLKQLLQIYVRLSRHHFQYQTSELILFILYYMIAGILRVDNTRQLQFNGVFKKLLGVKTFPNPTTIRRFLHSLQPKIIRQIVKLHNLLQQKLFFIGCQQTSAIFDLDPTAITVYDKRIQRAKRGYNPKQRGRKCFCLMLCFEDNHQEFWLGSLHSGNINPITFAKHFLKESTAKLPKTVKRIRVRADASFYDHKFILNIKELKMDYPLTKIPTQSYTANIAYLQLLLFAFNIANWFKRLCLPKEFRSKTLQTIREDFISIPARLIKSGHSNILKFPAGYPYQNLVYHIIEKIKNMKI